MHRTSPPGGFGITTDHDGSTDPYLAVKGVRDIASGMAVFVLLAARKPRILGGNVAAASIIPIGDRIIVLRNNGSKATAYGIHVGTAAAMLTTGTPKTVPRTRHASSSSASLVDTGPFNTTIVTLQGS